MSLPPARDKARMLILLSGACMGCAILVKIPSFVMIPLVLVLVWSAGRRPGRVLMWLVPVILIPAAWPASAALEGEFDQWVNGVLWQVDRNSQYMLDMLQQYIPVALVQGQDPDILTHPAILLMATIHLFQLDPVLVSLGMVGLAFAVLVRSRFLIMWIVPVLLFFGSIGWVQWVNLVMLWTVMCVAAAALIGSGIGRASAGRWGPRGQHTLLLVAVFAAAAIGLSTSGVLVHWDATSAYSEAMSFALQNYGDSDSEIIMPKKISASWLLDIYNLTDSNVARGFFGDNKEPEKTKKIAILEYVSRIEQSRHMLEAHHGAGSAASSLEADLARRYAELYDEGNRVVEFHNLPKPDTAIPSTIHGYVGHRVAVMEWSPPGWASLPAYGPPGRALHLDGTAYVTLAAAPGLNLGGADPFSISFWIKMLGPGHPDSSIISKAEAARHQGITVWGGHGGGISLRMADNAKSHITVNTFSGMADGLWHHVVFTYDGSGDRSGLDVYVDGRIDNVRWHNTWLAGSVANDHPIAIGASSTGRGPAQDIVLDDIMIYSARLSAGHISGVHECHVEMAAVSAPDHECMVDYDGALLIHLEFEGDLSDSSGGGNGGTAHGDVAYVQQTLCVNEISGDAPGARATNEASQGRRTRDCTLQR